MQMFLQDNSQAEQQVLTSHRKQAHWGSTGQQEGSLFALKVPRESLARGPVDQAWLWEGRVPEFLRRGQEDSGQLEHSRWTQKEEKGAEGEPDSFKPFRITLSILPVSRRSDKPVHQLTQPEYRVKTQRGPPVRNLGLRSTSTTGLEPL